MSWNQLLTIVKEARDPSFTTKPVVACPNDGEPLRSGPNGELFCPYDGYRPDGMDTRS